MSLPVCCGACAGVIYRLEPDEGDGLPRLVGSSPIGPPIEVVVSDRLRFIFCSRGCLLEKLAGLPDQDLRGGYPLDLSLVRGRW
jgi:hypothetical protein